MSFQYRVGDIVVSKTGNKVEVVGHIGTRAYKVKILTHKNTVYVGLTKTVPKHILESQTYNLDVPAMINKAVATIPSLPVNSIASNMVQTLSSVTDQAVEELNRSLRGDFQPVEKRSACDCGAHKCGYADDELHGHARWCFLNERNKKSS